MRREIARPFSAATARIDARFRRYYALLAPDGEAALRVVPDDDDGPSGVEVVARPPGKVLDRVDVLSGGERSLAALSFALALFQETPAPFFILDEVEPALDDSNIRRLQAVLEPGGRRAPAARGVSPAAGQGDRATWSSASSATWTARAR